MAYSDIPNKLVDSLDYNDVPNASLPNVPREHHETDVPFLGDVDTDLSSFGDDVEGSPLQNH